MSLYHDGLLWWMCSKGMIINPSVITFDALPVIVWVGNCAGRRVGVRYLVGLGAVTVLLLLLLCEDEYWWLPL